MREIKVLSVCEPHASLIANGKKVFETRSWKTNYRGKIYIHASSTKIPKSVREEKPLWDMAGEMELHPGFILCEAILFECYKIDDHFLEALRNAMPQEFDCGYYEPGRYAWWLMGVKPIEPIKAKGHLGIWTYEMKD